MPGTLANIGRSCPHLVYLDVCKTLPEAAAGTRGVCVCAIFFFWFGGWVSADALEYIDSKLLFVCVCVYVHVCVCVCACILILVLCTACGQLA